MAELGLQSLIAGVRIISRYIKLSCKVGIRQQQNVRPRQLAASRAEVGDGEDISLSESPFYRRVPLIPSG